MFKHKAKGTRANNTLIPRRGLDLGAANKKVVSSKSQSGEASHFLPFLAATFLAGFLAAFLVVFLVVDRLAKGEISDGSGERRKAKV